MSDLIGKHAIVVGAGMGGLAAAKALSAHFDHVTVLERDSLSSDAEPRRGTPQARHLHGLLTGGLNALTELLPGLEKGLEQAGAVRLRSEDLRSERPGFDPFPQRDLGLGWWSVSRPLLEFETRRHVEQQNNIKLVGNRRVTEFVALPDGSAVTAVRCEAPDGQIETLAANLVVDASGRGALTQTLLEKSGLPKPEETEIGIDIAYSTAVFEQPVDAPSTWKSVMTFPAAPDSSRGALLSPIENNQWIVSVGGNHGDVPPGDMEGYLAFIKGLRTPTVYDAVKNARSVGEIARFMLPCSRRRHFETVQRFPRGLLVIGDAICRFNPVFGQGMSVAAQEAVILHRLLIARAGDLDPLNGLAEAFFAGIQEVLETPWGVAINDFIFPKTRGQRPADFEQRIRYGGALFRLAAEDASVHKLMIEVNHLLKPRSALRAPEIAERVIKLMGPVPA
jgi:2-polyprenyl-6-methoxyphenol hydroxylase-like FAD-dependent oxidoreductase